MTEITNEKRMSIFAAYSSALVVTNSFVCRQVGLGYDTQELVLSATGGVITDSFISPVKDCRLSLVPLDRISDEDAIEVSKIEFGYNKPLTEDEVSRGFTKPKYAEFVEAVKENLDMFHSQSADYLRSKSYNCGYGEYTPQDLIDAGVVINETK